MGCCSKTSMVNILANMVNEWTWWFLQTKVDISLERVIHYWQWHSRDLRLSWNPNHLIKPQYWVVSAGRGRRHPRVLWFVKRILTRKVALQVRHWKSLQCHFWLHGTFDLQQMACRRHFPNLTGGWLADLFMTPRYNWL